jgi:hypothetical protein
MMLGPGPDAAVLHQKKISPMQFFAGYGLHDGSTAGHLSITVDRKNLMFLT